MTIVAIIPARGGSKGLERKNLTHVGGFSLVARSIRHAKRVERIESVWVTTDDPEIMDEASAHGARVIKRPAELATDEASTDDALVHALGVIRSSGRDPSIVVVLQPTTPFRQAHTMQKVIDNCPAFSAYEQWQYDWTDGYPFDDGRQRRQDRKPRIIEDGSVYSIGAAELTHSGSRVNTSSLPVIHLGTAYHLEIDTSRDLNLAMAIAGCYDVMGDK